ncbi:hypothetical protein CK203_116855 [Vitis vinifera]|uniref:Retroviral polymerase SH3-like domain-containing protein n=1 Tax=Vitis vinifera TaxID=29760 RepID=A0A438FFJ1_VITVI|nr:hypothetical protein CK203_116855 [Vitis vinifera]
MNQDLVRLDRFDGSNFTRWQDKVRFLLTALKIFYILDPTLAPLPEPKENDTPQVLYDLYTNTNSAREIWEALENKYKAEEEVLKIELPEAFQVGAIVAKLPSSWKGYRKRILHKSEDYSLEEIQNIFALRKNRDQETKWWKSPMVGLTKPMRFQRPIILECRFRKDQKGAVVNAIDEEIIATLSDVCIVQGKTFEDAKEIKRFKWAMKENPSGDLLGKPGIKRVFESGKLILTKSGNFVGKGIPMKKNEISPYELWKGRKPNIGYFKVWGCLAYCKKTDPNKTKLGPRAIKCAFVGYASNSKAYRLLDLESNVIIESREVEFFENLLSDSNSQVPTSVGESQEETPSKVVEQPIVPRKSQRARKRKCWDRMRLTLKEFPFT